MALRQILFVRGIGNLGNPNLSLSELNFVKRQRLSTNAVRFIRNKGLSETPNPLKSSFQPFEGYVPPPNFIKSNVLAKTALFTVAFTAGSFMSVTIWEYEKIRSKAMNILQHSNPMNWMKRKPKSGEHKTELQVEIERLQKELDVAWSKITPGERVFVPILLLNVIVYGLWRVPRLKPLMLQYFCSNPAAKAICWPMFLSTFSHYSLFHLFANMYVLHSFSAAVNGLGREQFLGLYMSAGVISSLASYAFKVATANPGYSLGASGAIMAVLAYVCARYPDTTLSILFIPQLQFSAGNAIQAVMAFDLAGIIFKWKMFDHAAHLGGALCGLFWAYYGQQHLWPLREHFVGYWHELRGKTQK